MLTKILLLKNNKFLFNSILYILGTMMTPAIGLIMLPIYTKYLIPAEYGTMTMIQTLAGMIQLVLLLSLNGAVSRFYFDFLGEVEKQKKYLGSIFTFVMIFSTLMSIIFLLLQNPVGGILFHNIPINPYYYYLIGISWGSSLFALPLTLWRAQEKAGLFVTINIFKSFSIMVVSAFLLIVKDLGAEAVLMSHLIITIVFVFISITICSNSIIINLNSTYIKDSLKFSLPLLPHVASGWIIKSSDRVILEKFVALSEIGLYSLAIQVAGVLSLFYSGVNNAFAPRYTKLRKEGNIKRANRLMKMFGLVVLVFGIIAIPVAMSAIILLTTTAYKGALAFIPILIIGEIIKGLYFLPVAKLFYAKSTKSIASSSIVAAIANIVFNFILIPHIGAFGSAIATIIAELIRFSLIYYFSKKQI